MLHLQRLALADTLLTEGTCEALYMSYVALISQIGESCSVFRYTWQQAVSQMGQGRPNAPPFCSDLRYKGDLT